MEYIHDRERGLIITVYNVDRKRTVINPVSGFYVVDSAAEFGKFSEPENCFIYLLLKAFSLAFSESLQSIKPDFDQLLTGFRCSLNSEHQAKFSCV